MFESACKDVTCLKESGVDKRWKVRCGRADEET
jgi:hypothetical protein